MTNRDAWTARLSEYVDGELPADERVALERHLDGCDACRATVAELGGVRDAAATLPERVDVPDLWPGIAQRIGAAPATASGPRSHRGPGRVPADGNLPGATA